MKIGVDGGGTKTELILVDDAGTIVERRIGPGCNPSVAGPDAARLILTDALCSLTTGIERTRITHTLLCMAGSRLFWRDTAATLGEFGRVHTTDDSLPVLELATEGQPGLVLHAGTGSFVAARTTAAGDPLDSVYAGGLGWRFGDPGSGYDLGRRLVARGLLELQGWAPASRLGPVLRDHTGLPDAAAITRHFYSHAEPTRIVAALAPHLLHLASEGDPVAQQLVLESTGELHALALRVATQLFPDTALDCLRAGLSGPILTHPAVVDALTRTSPLALVPITVAPIEGVRHLLARLPAA
ncbi:BadF/BadG/BcrA/BcrD ATPase family protein [Opitutaceae bacterium]